MAGTAVIQRRKAGGEGEVPAFPDILLGLTLLERAVLSLRQKGVERIVVVGDRDSLTAEATDLRPRVVGKLPEFIDAADAEKLRAVFDGDGGDVMRVREEVVCDVTVTSPESYREAERRLLESVRKETDGFIARTLNRPVSLRLSKIFIRLGLTPNQISVGNLAVGLVGAWFAAAGGYFNIALGALLFQLSSIVDGSDGEVAKLTYTGSERGSWIDTLCDELTCLAFFVALPVGLYRTTGDGVYVALVAGTLLSGGVLYALMIRYVSGTKDHGSMVQILDDFRESARLPGLFGMVNRFVSSLSFVVRRDFFAFLIMVLCLIGQARLVVWIIGVLAPLSVVYFAYYSRRKTRGPAAAAETEEAGGSAGQGRAMGGNGKGRWDELKYRARRQVSKVVMPNSPSAASVPFVEYLKWFRFSRFTPDYPLSLDIQTRSGCNARCAFCGVNREKNRIPGAMSDELFRKIVDEALTWPNLRQINPYLLNDPLVDRRLEERLDYIIAGRGDRRRPLVRIITNAGLMRDGRARRLLETGIDEINISFNSIVPEVYERAMRPLKYDRVMANIHELIRQRDRLGVKKPKISIWTVLTREVEDNLADEKAYWKKLGVGFKARKLDNRARSDVEEAQLGRRPMDLVRICPIPFWRAWVMWNGDMILCCVDQERSTVLGNCTDRSIREIWNNPAYRQLREKWRTGRLEGLLCEHCKGS